MLDEILNVLGSKHPLRSKPICIADNERYGDGYTKYDNLTKSGWKAYNKLTDIVYKLEEIGVIDNANNVVEQLDSIVDSKEF